MQAAGTSLDNVVKCNIYLTSMKDFGAVNEVYATIFKAPVPVSVDLFNILNYVLLVGN